MAKLPSVSTITTGYASVQALNDNFEALKNAFTNTVSRDGSTPNSMSADLDLNSNDVKNVKTIDADSFILNGTLMTPSGVDPVYSGTISAFGASLIDDENQVVARDTLGLGVLATENMNYVNNNVEISNDNWVGADLDIVNGGTGASSAGAARNNLGLGTAAVVDVLDEDDMLSNSATDVPSQQSVKSYVDAAVQDILGVGQTWQNMAGLRSANVTYTNDTGRTITVSVEIAQNAGYYFQLYIDGAWVTLQRGDGSAAIGWQGPIANGQQYRVTGVFNRWFELR